MFPVKSENKRLYYYYNWFFIKIIISYKRQIQIFKRPIIHYTDNIFRDLELNYNQL